MRAPKLWIVLAILGVLLSMALFPMPSMATQHGSAEGIYIFQTDPYIACQVRTLGATFEPTGDGLYSVTFSGSIEWLGSITADSYYGMCFALSSYPNPSGWPGPYVDTPYWEIDYWVEWPADSRYGDYTFQFTIPERPAGRYYYRSVIAVEIGSWLYGPEMWVDVPGGIVPPDGDIDAAFEIIGETRPPNTFMGIIPDLIKLALLLGVIIAAYLALRRPRRDIHGQ